MKHSDFMAYFRDIATRQPDIKHTPEEKHFYRIIYSEWPTPDLQLEEFLQSIKSDLHFPFLLIETFRKRLRAETTEHRRNHFTASFFIGDKIDKGDFDGLEELFDNTDRISEDVAGYMIQEFDAHLDGNDLPKRYLDTNMEFEKIGPFGDNLYGTRCQFGWNLEASEWQMHDTDLWLPVTPP